MYISAGVPSTRIALERATGTVLSLWFAMKYSAPCVCNKSYLVYISAGVPSTRMALTNDTRMERATGTVLSLWFAMKYSAVVFCFPPLNAW